MEDTIPALFSSDVLKSEFQHVQGSCYLDQTGSALYAKSQVESIAKDLCDNLYTNPHSNSLSSKLCGDMVDQVRYRILQHFNTTTNHYSVIFTSGATAALKIVAETFDFAGKYVLSEGERSNDNTAASCGTFMYLKDNHTSVLGMRNVDNIVHDGVPVRCLSHSEAFQTLSSTTGSSTQPTSRGNSLFAYPAQCNFSGLKYPLSWIEKIQNGALEERQMNIASRCKWFCLLDAATHVSTNPLDLSQVQPDFVAISFYKMWGLPTGLGALLVLNRSAYVLHKHYFGGGTVQVALPSQPVHVFRTELHERFEDGTINFLSICALRQGLDWQVRAGLDMQAVSLHCFSLARYTYRRLCSLHHSNARAAVHVYSDTQFDDPDVQGGIVNFNILRDTGDFVGYFEVLTMANLHNIHLRAGCFCNPGACQRHLGISEHEYYTNFEAGHVCGDDIDLIEGRPTGSVRVSFGPYSVQQDADRLILMLSECFVNKSSEEKKLQENEKLDNKFMGESGLIGCTPINAKTGSTEDKSLKSEEKVLCSPTSKNQLTSQAAIVVSRICIYPVKSCGAFEVHRWQLGRRGLLYDRCWMVVTEAGVALTQKQEPRLCVIKPVIDLCQGQLVLTFKGHPSCSVPLDPPTSDMTEARLCQSKVCGDNIGGIDCGNSASQWLNHVLGRNGLRLLRQSDSHHRAAKSKDKDDAASPLALANQAQFLLINENSVSWLTDRLSVDSECSKTNMLDRFRSNFAIRGKCAAFDEQKWKEVHIGTAKFKIEGPCGRCQMICIDQATGERTKEPLTTLAANCQGRIKFGIYLRHRNYSDECYVSVGDVVDPLIV